MVEVSRKMMENKIFRDINLSAIQEYFEFQLSVTFVYLLV